MILLYVSHNYYVFVFTITLLLCIALYAAVILLYEKIDFLYLSGILVIRACLQKKPCPLCSDK